jgi:hypothetical protein
MHIFDVSITTVQGLKNVSLKVWEELITQTRYPTKYARPAFTILFKPDALCVGFRIAKDATRLNGNILLVNESRHTHHVY